MTTAAHSQPASGGEFPPDPVAASGSGNPEQWTPEEIDRILTERAATLARPAGESVPPGQLTLLSFELGGEQLLLDIEFIREVMPLHQLVPVPDTPTLLAGVTNLRGELLAALDLRPLFQLPLTPIVLPARLLVIGQEQAEFGLVVDRVGEVLHLSPAALFLPPDALPAEARNLVQGVTREARLALNGNTLLTDPRLYIEMV